MEIKTVKTVKIANLKPHPKNPRIHPESAITKPHKRGYKLGNCKECGQIYSARADTKQQFCSVICSTIYSGRMKQGKSLIALRRRQSRSCLWCNNIFEIRPSDQKVYCSAFCRENDYRSRYIIRTCKECKTQFRLRKSAISSKTNATGNYCSKVCYNKALKVLMAGENNPHYRGAQISDGYRLHSFDWRKIRRRMLQISPFCWSCTSFKRLEIHHILPWHWGGGNSFDNLAVLCKKCHKHYDGRFAIDINRNRDMDPKVLALIHRFNIIDKLMVIIMAIKAYKRGIVDAN